MTSQAKLKAKHGRCIFQGSRPTGYTYQYSQSDFGTERNLQLFDSTGQVVAQGDPFYLQGIPANLLKRQKQINDYAVSLCQEVMVSHAH